MKISINTTAKSVPVFKQKFLIERIDAENMAIPWQNQDSLIKAKQLTFTSGDEKSGEIPRR
jgi:hypothetical protein